MKKLSVFLFVMLLFLGSAGMANATLYDRGGGLIYNDVLDITWLQDANYAKTSGYDSDGKMHWDNAKAWVDQLVFAGYDDWRLPLGFPLGDSYNDIFKYDGTSDWGYNITDETKNRSEMAYLFYVELNNLAKYDMNGSQRSPGSYGLQNTGPFINLTGLDTFWTDTEISNNRALLFTFDDDSSTGRGSGLKGRAYKNNELLYAWAVRDGDVTSVPEPATLALLASGMIALAGFRRKWVTRGCEA